METKEKPKWRVSYREWWRSTAGKYVHTEDAYKAGYEAAEAALRERIIAELEEKIIHTLAGTVANMGWNDGVKAAIEIVKGGEE